MSAFVSYLRVSAGTEGCGGLGLHAQRSAIAAFATTHMLTSAAEFAEIETGKGNEALELRPSLEAALELARRLECPVMVARLDRLSRDVACVAGLMAHRVPFVVTGP